MFHIKWYYIKRSQYVASFMTQPSYTACHNCIHFYPKSKKRLVEVGFTHLKLPPLASSLVALEFLCTICNPVCLQGGLGTDSLMSQCNEREYCDNQSSKHQRRAAHAAFLLNYSHNLVSRRKNKSGNLNKFTWRHLLKFKYIRCKLDKHQDFILWRIGTPYLLSSSGLIYGY